MNIDPLKTLIAQKESEALEFTKSTEQLRATIVDPIFPKALVLSQ